VGRSAVVVEIALGAGILVVVGSTGFASNRWIAADDNAAFVSWALTGELRPQAAGLARDHRPDPSAGHPAVPSVVAGDGRALLDLVPPAGTPIGGRAFLSAAARAGRLLPTAVHDALVDLVDVGDDAGALLVKGLPVGQVPATPSTPVSPTGKDRVSELVLLTVARRLGQPVGYQPEHGGDIVQNLLPTRAHADRQTSTSSTVQLEFHTETAFHRHKPRFLLLLCLRGDPNARTLLCSIRAVVDHLPLRVRQVLSEPRFRTGVDESFTGERTHRLGRPVAVLEGTMAEPTMTFDADLMVGLDDRANDALEDLRQLIRTHHVGVALEAGDLLVVDNAVSVHGRSPFPARFDGTDRWLQRTFVVADLAASATERAGRVITTRFDD
jgi:alpha-ketoglutarate-dependent taurine dioxygenase